MKIEGDKMKGRKKESVEASKMRPFLDQERKKVKLKRKEWCNGKLKEKEKRWNQGIG